MSERAGGIVRKGTRSQASRKDLTQSYIERKELTPKIDPSQRQDMLVGCPLTRGAGNEGKLDCGAEERMGVGWEGESRDCWMTRSANEQEEVYSQTRLTPIVESEVQHPGALSGSPRRKADRARRTARVASTGGEMVGISSSISGPPSQRGGWVGNGRESVDRSKVSGGRTITNPGGTIHQLKAWEPGKRNEWARGMKTRHVGDQMEEASCKSEEEEHVRAGWHANVRQGGYCRHLWGNGLSEKRVHLGNTNARSVAAGKCERKFLAKPERREKRVEGGRVVVDDGGAMWAGREKSASADQPEAEDLGDTINEKMDEGKGACPSGKDRSAVSEGSVDLSKARQEEGGTE
ncbi:hypothetical protein BJ322DRAFT_1025503 [Thelephora terrestris]|uniref:Uncharacterized protein n=1 Tax=Thelephora terrestris TaxID=56493 RepID=A0A9P6L191_9AGAM|nr:hypothetical protein BJ322DRAFT_1025503 [Thelephora terrestris]